MQTTRMLLAAASAPQLGFYRRCCGLKPLAEMQAALGTGPLPDVVLADYNLPNFSGPEALDALLRSGRFRHPVHHDVGRHVGRDGRVPACARAHRIM